MAQTTSPRSGRSKTSRRSSGRNGGQPEIKHRPASKPQAAKKATAAKGRAPNKKPSARMGPSAKKATKKVAEKATPSLFEPTSLTGKLATKAAKKMGGKALESGLELIRRAADRAAATGSEALSATAQQAGQRRLPIQRSVDIAVPLRVAWEEWMALEFIPEGVHTVTDVEWEGEDLFGRTSGPRATDWEAEILDLREEQSFAWQSHQGSDCAGLLTFHELSERLTRIELQLDVIATNPAERFSLATHLADRRAETDLRRFKARLELINPDLYEPAEAEHEDEDGAEGEGAEASEQDHDGTDDTN